MNNNTNKHPQLDEISPGNPFVVPEGYFENLHNKINTRISKQPDDKKQIRIAAHWKAYAAAAILIIAVVTGGRKLFFGSSENDLLQSEISSLVETEIYSIQESAIIDAMAVENPEGTDLKSSDAIEYLINENVNETDLVDAL